MINSFFNLHFYLLLNLAISIGYVLSRFILGIPFFNNGLSQAQRLKFARHSFFYIIILFFLIPNFLLLIPLATHSDFYLGPILKSTAATFFQRHSIINGEITPIGLSGSFFSMNILIITLLFFGFSIFFRKYINNLFMLKKIQETSFCQHNIHHVQILFNNIVEIPFCWSFFKKHFIVIPNLFLEKNNDLHLVIQHELQHIRQHDTYWSHFLTLLKCVCFWNPFLVLWIYWLDELQELSCDETMISRKKISPLVYAQCLVNASTHALEKKLLPQGALGIQGLSKKILYRRVNMLFKYKNSRIKKSSIIFAYLVSFFVMISTAYAFNGSPVIAALSEQEVQAMIKQSHLDESFQLSATPEVVNEINKIHSSEQARSFMDESLQRMKQYQHIIQSALIEKSMPIDLLVVPLVESGYQPLDQKRNPVLAAGIWQIVPDTAKNLGLVINTKQDDRLDTNLSTRAALTYFKSNYEQFKSWKLAFIAYEIGEDNTAKLIRTTHSSDAWVLARSSVAPSSLKKSLAFFEAALIIMHNPSLINEHR